MRVETFLFRLFLRYKGFCPCVNSFDLTKRMRKSAERKGIFMTTKTKDYLKLIAIKVDHMESEIADERNFTNDSEGIAKFEEAKKKLENDGFVCLKVMLECPAM